MFSYLDKVTTSLRRSVMTGVEPRETEGVVGSMM